MLNFVSHRLRQFTAALGPERFANFEAMDHDSLGSTLVKLMKRGIPV